MADYETLKAFVAKKEIDVTKYLEKEIILTEYKNKEKTKPLTTEERLTRIERVLGII